MTHFMLRAGFLVALLTLPQAGRAETAKSLAAVAEHHMAAFATESLDEVVSDYADDAMIINDQGVAQGKAAIREFWSTRVSPGMPKLTSTVQPAVGSVVVAPWSLGAGTPTEMRGKDVFVIRNGKIQTQVVFIDAPAAK